MPVVTLVNPLSMVGLMLTLAGLVGTFFYIQLSGWLRDVQALHAKIDLNKLGNTDDNKKAIRECRVEQARIASWQTAVVNVVVIGFVWFVLQIGFQLIAMAPTDPVAKPTRHALEVFQVIFLVLSIGLFVIGLWISVSNHRELEKLKPKSAAPKAD